MRNEEVRPCDCCGRGLSSGMQTGHVGARLTIQFLTVNQVRMQQHVGLETFFGGGRQGRVLADIMGLGAGAAIDEDKKQRHELIVCNECSVAVCELLIKARRRKNELVEAKA